MAQFQAPVIKSLTVLFFSCSFHLSFLSFFHVVCFSLPSIHPLACGIDGQISLPLVLFSSLILSFVNRGNSKEQAEDGSTGSPGAEEGRRGGEELRKGEREREREKLRAPCLSVFVSRLKTCALGVFEIALQITSPHQFPNHPNPPHHSPPHPTPPLL